MKIMLINGRLTAHPSSVRASFYATVALSLIFLFLFSPKAHANAYITEVNQYPTSGTSNVAVPNGSNYWAGNDPYGIRQVGATSEDTLYGAGPFNLWCSNGSTPTNNF